MGVMFAFDNFCLDEIRGYEQARIIHVYMSRKGRVKVAVLWRFRVEPAIFGEFLM